MSGEKAYVFRDPGSIAKWAVAGLSTWLALDVLNCVLLGLQYRLLVRMQSGVFSSREEMVSAANANDMTVTLSARLLMAVVIVATVLFLVWVYRTCANVHALGSRHLSATPGLAVGNYFIPVISFYAPPVIMNQVWKASLDAPNWNKQKGTPVVALWWILMILSGVGGWISLLLSPTTSEIVVLQNFSLGMAGYFALCAMARVSTLYLVGVITRRQAEQRRAVSSS